jgi:hypothetical protein
MVLTDDMRHVARNNLLGRLQPVDLREQKLPDVTSTLKIPEETPPVRAVICGVSSISARPRATKILETVSGDLPTSMYS